MRLKKTALLLSIPIAFATAEFKGTDYSDAMRMSVKFFGAQRCGDTHNWMLYDNTSNLGDICHTKDSYNGHDVSGGWHDCGDHIKVATTMGYAAICLLSAYDIWPKAFEDHHNPEYVATPNGIPDILDEVKIATDYFMKSFINGTTFVYYVGDAHDHERWVTSSFQSTLGSALGGDPRPVTATSNAGGAQAADYASALALMAMHYPDQTYAQKCKESALKLYAYAKANQSNINIPEFYSSPNSEISDELSLAAILLYHLTKTESYKNDALSYLKGKWESNSALAWDTKTDISYYYLTKADPASNNGDKYGGTFSSFLKKNVQSAIKGANSYGIPWGWLKSNWGTNKLACGSAFAATLYAKLIEDGVITAIDGLTAEAANDYAKKIINYMLGENEFKHPFLHGYKGDMTHKVHHRNAMGRDDNPPTNVKNTSDFKFASGALIGGPMSQGSFQNTVEGGNAFMETESGCDYNGPFVAALANLVSKLDPKSSAISKFYKSKGNNINTYTHDKYIRITDIRGRRIDLMLFKVNRIAKPGIYIIQHKNEAKSTKIINLQ